MNTIKTSFSIKDLENLSGIKAHTIRIWEKRYNLLIPERTDTNIRTYNLQSLQKLLNISFLNSNGYKVSQIAALDEFQIATKVKEISFLGNVESHAFNAFKLSMLNFDQALFYNTYNRLLEEKSFREIFYDAIYTHHTRHGAAYGKHSPSNLRMNILSAFISDKKY